MTYHRAYRYDIVVTFRLTVQFLFAYTLLHVITYHLPMFQIP
jgi:hypothetical protein